MMKYAKIFSLFFIIMISVCNTYAQIENKTLLDTFYINEEYVKFCIGELSITLSAGKYYYNGTEIDKTRYMKLDRFAEQICDSLLDKATGKYCRFFNKDSVVIEEGIWYREFYMGQYKSYYDNGKIKSIGCYTKDHKSDKAGDKIGKWLYYDKKGKLIRTENHK